VVRALVPCGEQVRLLLTHERALEQDPLLRAHGSRLLDTLASLIERGRAGALPTDTPARWQVRVVADLVWSTWAAVAAGELARLEAPEVAVDTILAALARRERP
jgi:hypothetical protein